MNAAYVAGFFDGEGCVGFAKNRSTIYPRVLITNTNIDVLKQIQNMFGGDIKPLSKRKENWKQGFYLRICWQKAVDFLSEIYPYLVVKNCQAETVFAWDAIRLGSGTKDKSIRDEYADTCEMLIKRMHWLNKKGCVEGKDPIYDVIEQNINS